MRGKVTKCARVVRVSCACRAPCHTLDRHCRLTTLLDTYILTCHSDCHTCCTHALCRHIPLLSSAHTSLVICSLVTCRWCFRQHPTKARCSMLRHVAPALLQSVPCMPWWLWCDVSQVAEALVCLLASSLTMGHGTCPCCQYRDSLSSIPSDCFCLISRDCLSFIHASPQAIAQHSNI